MGFTRAAVGGKITAAMYNELADAPRLYTFVDAPDRGVEATMVKGDFGYQVDTDITYRFNGSTWREWFVPWRAYTPTTVNVSGGTITGSWTRTGDRVTVSIMHTFAGANLTGQPTYSLPVNHLNASVEWLEGTVLLRDNSPAAEYLGVVRKNSTTGIAPYSFLASGTYVSFANVNATTPFTWAVDDTLVMNFSYRAA